MERPDCVVLPLLEYERRGLAAAKRISVTGRTISHPDSRAASDMKHLFLICSIIFYSFPAQQMYRGVVWNLRTQISPLVR